MISQIRGTISYVGLRSVVVDVAGIGYELNVTGSGLLSAQTGQKVTYWTHLAVRETSMELFGFRDQQELHFFEMLLDVSGIGPRSALGIIDLASIETLKKAIATKDTSYLTKVSGIGKKTAEKIIVELQDKLVEHSDDAGSVELREESEALEALQSLGYSLSQSREALKQVPSEYMGTTDRLKEALKIINNHS